MRSIIACMLVACASVAFAQDVLIRGATVYTVSEQGDLPDTDVLIRDGKIEAIGRALTATPGTPTIDAKGRPLTPGLFGGLSAIGIEEVSLEPTTADANLLLNAPAFETEWRPEFDVTLAYNPRSVLVPVARIEGLTWTVLRDRPYAVVSLLNMVLQLHIPMITLAIPLWIVERTNAPGWTVSALLVLNTVSIVLCQVTVANRVTSLKSATRYIRYAGGSGARAIGRDVS